MGLTISSPNKSIDMSASGFMRLRTTIAYLHSVELGKHYDLLRKCNTPEEYDKYDSETVRLANNAGSKFYWLFDFLYESDIEGKLTYGKCHKLLDLIGDYDDDICYGYAGLPDCAKFKDFKDILSDCVQNKRQMTWY